MINQICIYILCILIWKILWNFGTTTNWWYKVLLVIHPRTASLTSLTGRSLFLPASLVLRKKNFWPRYINENEIYIKILEHEWKFLVLNNNLRFDMFQRYRYLDQDRDTLLFASKCLRNRCSSTQIWYHYEYHWYWPIKYAKITSYPGWRIRVPSIDLWMLKKESMPSISICQDDLLPGARCWYSQRGVWTN